MNGNAAVAVNTAPRESDLTHGNAEEMAAGWMSSKPAVYTQEERPTAEEQDQRRHFWTYLLIGAAFFLAAESLLSNLRFTIDGLRLKPNGIADRPSSIINRQS
jgi:VanZ family protein